MFEKYFFFETIDFIFIAITKCPSCLGIEKFGPFIGSNLSPCSIPKKGPHKISIEAASTEPWKKLIGNYGFCFGLDDYGKSAPYRDIFRYFGLTSENIVNKIKKMLNKQI